MAVDVSHSRYMAEHIPGARYVELPGSDHLPWIGDVEPVVATVLFVDAPHAVGGVEAPPARERLAEVVRSHLARFRGDELAGRGDSLGASFDGPARAIRCAEAIVAEGDRSGTPCRAGLHTGECEPHDAVLDLGCGTGVVTRALAARPGFAGTVTGVDQSPEFLAAAERLAASEGVGDRVEFVLGDAHELDFPEASFDAVVGHTLVSHVRDPLAVLAQAARVVRPGGAVAVFDGDYASLTFGCSDARLRQAMESAIQSMIMSSPRVICASFRACCPGPGCG